MRDEHSGWISLHPGELFLLWTSLDLGEPPAILQLPHIGRTAPARAELAALAGDALDARDLGTVERPAADLARLLRLVAATDRKVELEADGMDRSLRCVGVIAGGDQAAALAMSGTEVRVGPLRHATLVAAMIDALPASPAGPGASANVRVEDYLAACEEGDGDGVAGFEDSLLDAGVRGQEAKVFSRAIADRVGGGRFVAAASDGEGHWTRSRSPLNWVDTPHGRYAIRRSGDWVTVAPADRARLVRMAEELVDEL
jgi:hypothetical protein